MWDDCQQMLLNLFTTEVKKQILIKEAKALPRIASMVDDQMAEAIDHALTRSPNRTTIQREVGDHSLNITRFCQRECNRQSESPLMYLR